MAVFNGHVIVNTGRELLGRALAGEGKIIITRAAMGDGKANKNIRELTELVSEKITANVADIFNDRGTVNLKVQITNSTLEEAFKTEEFGIFAKIEGDKQEVLYSYCNAIEADTIPSNSLGDIFVEEHTVYIAFSSDAEADIYIKEGAVFLSLDTANKNYVTTGLIVEGKLSNGRNSLKENCQYQGDNGKWYHNIGGNRSWEVGVGVADDKLIEITYFNLYNEVIKKQNEVENRLLTKKKNIWEAINEVHESKLSKGTLPPAFDNTEKIFKALQGNTGIKFDENLLYLNDEGTKKVGLCYLDRLTDGIFECIQETTTVNNATYFKNFSNKENSDRLSNLKGNLTSLEKTVNDIDTTYKEEDKKINFKINKIENTLQDFKLKKYGVKFTGSNPVGKRTHDAVGMVANVGVDSEVVVNDFDSVPFYNRPVCCGVHDENGNFIVNAYEGEPGFTRDGSNGDVYYECTPFYWNGSFEEPVVSAIEFEGSKLAPMFDSPDKKVYLPCYWASLTSDGKYRSISGQYPEWSSLNGHMEKCRKTNINAHTETIKAHMTEYILQLVEFATKDLQTIMMGVCNMVWEHTDKVATQETTNQNYIVIAKDKAKSYVVGQTITNSGSWNNNRRVITKIEDQADTNAYIYFENQEPLSVKAGVKISSFPYKTGATDKVKASSGSAVSNTDGKHQCKWRGKEAPWAEGFSGLCDILRKIEEDGNHYPYLLKDPKKYNNGILTGDYVKLDYTLPKENGYAKTLGVNPKYPYAAITNEIGASSNTYLSAYYYTNTNPLTVAFVGGYWYRGRNCSPVYFYLGYTPSDSSVDWLARLFVTAV